MRSSAKSQPRFMCLALAVMSATAVVAAPAQRPPARTPRPGGTSSATRVISPVALVTWVAHYGADGTQTLDLLVLWRGAPGWFAKGAGSGTSSGGNSESFHSTIRYGGLELQLELQPQTRFATIQGKPIELQDDNVVLVDEVGSPGGPFVARTLRVDPELPRTDNGYPMIETVLRRSPAIVEFLRCDTRVPDGRAQAVVDRICDQVLGR
jgi:hypothetical protein